MEAALIGHFAQWFAVEVLVPSMAISISIFCCFLVFFVCVLVDSDLQEVLVILQYRPTYNNSLLLLCYILRRDSGSL